MSAAKSGIEPGQLARLTHLFESWPAIERVWLFGSRARGDYRAESDIDLALDAPRVSSADFSRIMAALEELPLLYRVDLVHLQEIGDATFRRLIERDRLADRLFADAVHAGHIEFALRADRFDYEIPHSFAVDTGERPRILQRPDGSLAQRSLFEPVYEALFDDAFEGEFACYLDAQSALTWWHRNVAKAQYGLQGWRRQKVYPDFIFLGRRGGDKAQLVVMETKGAHLQNEDTEYKRELLQRLTHAYRDERLASAGELQLVARDGTRIVCDLVFDANWKNELNARYFAR